MTRKLAVISAVRNALGSRRPARQIRTPRQPAICFPNKIVIAIRLIPGVNWQSAQSRLNCSSVVQPKTSTEVRRISKVVVVPPPNDWIPIPSQTRNKRKRLGKPLKSSSQAASRRLAPTSCKKLRLDWVASHPTVLLAMTNRWMTQHLE